MAKLFPKYLDKGSKGPAVAMLQVLLVARGYNDDNIIVDGDYGDATAEGVRQLQEEFSLEEDGHFGPNSRAALQSDSDVNVDALDAELFVGETLAVGPDDEEVTSEAST